MNARQKNDSLTLEILATVEQRSDVSQRHIADRLGVALGLANSYLRRCTRKGLIKIKQAPANRYLYYLTPKGFAEKSRLTAQYLSISFDFYRRAGESCTRVFTACASMSAGRVLLCGVSELAEIASLRADEHGIVIVGTYDPGDARRRFVNRPVWRRIEDAAAFDACLITSLNEPAATYAELLRRVDSGRVFVPDLLGIRSTTGAPMRNRLHRPVR